MGDRRDMTNFGGRSGRPVGKLSGALELPQMPFRQREEVGRAALPLAKLYQSNARLAEAHAVLALALEGFSPTVEMPEIAEAQALLATIA